MFNNKVKKYISVLLTITVILASLLAGWVAYGDDLVAINPANFPDENWRTIVKGEYDANKDGFLSTSERSKVFISLSGVAEDYFGEDTDCIEDLTGISFFSNLQRLYVGSLGLKTLDVSSLKNLTQLTCQGNHLTSLRLGSLTKLTKLNCESNELMSINLAGCYSLEELYISTNKLETISVSNNPELRILSIYDNELERLDVSSNSLLEDLACSGNHLTTLDLSHNAKLTEISQHSIGDQTTSATARVSGRSVVVPFSLDANRVASTSLDTIVEGDSGDSSENKKISGYSATGNFTTTDVNNYKINDREGKPIDGDTIEYEYNVNNSNVENMNVYISVSRAFYQVRTYTNDSMTELITSQYVNAGKNAVVPTITDYPEDKIFGGWSDSFDNINEDKDIYIRWVNEHIWNITKFSKGDVTIHCDDCGDEYSFAFSDVLNKDSDDVHFVPVLDVVKDNIINAKDYAMLYRQFNR